MKELVLLIALIPSVVHSECKIDKKSVIYKEVPSYILQGRVAQSYISGGRYIIEYSSDIQHFPKLLKDHILAHECAHHKLNHTSMTRAYDLDSFEFEADCYAVKELKWDDSNVEELQTIWYSVYTKSYVDSRGTALKKCLHPN